MNWWLGDADLPIWLRASWKILTLILAGVIAYAAASVVSGAGTVILSVFAAIWFFLSLFTTLGDERWR